MLNMKISKLCQKDIKVQKKRGKDMQKFKFIIEELANNKSLAIKYKNHNLVGKYNKFKECHIELDWLLIYKIEGGTLQLIRTGTHSDLF